jgi:hypothetical protein
VFLDYMEVVEKPFSGRPDVDIGGGGGGEPGVGIVQNAPGVVEPGEQRPAAAPRPDAGEALAGGDGAGAIGEVLRPEQFAADRTGQELLAGLAAVLKESGKESAWRCRRDGGNLGKWTARASSVRKVMSTTVPRASSVYISPPLPLRTLATKENQCPKCHTGWTSRGGTN